MLTIRKANMQDAKILHEWRNDEATRKSSHNSSEVDYSSHVHWLEKTLSSTSRVLLIAESDGIPVGTARVDFESQSCAELSWTISPEQRGKGFAKAMMAIVSDKYKANLTLRAEVKEGNIASVAVAQHIGMTELEKKNGVIYFSLS
ncbi:GNAT family N-acetyltransferase [Kluyvera ascorbata]|uniref:GNAT family N-acetyltransferase n=1 Tax=Kluyvera ascorbata TaxID=51288 RepID=UPI00374DAABA